MKHLKKFEALTYSGKDVTKMPVIGKVITKPFMDFDSAEYNVVEIIQDKDKDVYIADSWYKPGVPQLIHSDLVQEYIPNE